MRSLRRTSVRTRIAALLVVLVTLWAFAAWVTVRESLNLLYLSYLETAGVATEEVVSAVQRERRLSTVVAAGEGAGEELAEELASARLRTDSLARGWQELIERRTHRLAANEQLSTRYERFAAELAQVSQVREEIDAGTARPGETLRAYSAVVAAGFAIYSSMSGLDDQEIARQSGLLVELSQAREYVSRQDALLAGALASGQLSRAELTEFTQLVGAQRLLYERTAAELPAPERARYDEAATSPAVQELRRLEDVVIAEGRPGAAVPVDEAAWAATTAEAMSTMRSMELAAVDVVVQRATPVIAGILIRLLIVVGLGTVAVVISINTGRTVIRRLEWLRDSARELATDRLPRVVRRLRAGEPVQMSAEAPPLPDTGGEVGQLATAFNRVQQAAVEAAVGQAELRRGVRDVFLSLARRTQGLVSRQLKALDEMERREADPDKMAELFRVDHLATRMRRNAENLIILSGANSGRTWRHPVSMVDLIRGAISEVEDYTRVTLLPVDEGAVPGQAAGDLIHLLAELVENAASFSPPYAPVTCSGQRVARGFAIEVEDRGLGMDDEELAAVNRRLAEPPDFDLADASHLGHYVVAKLAQRHEVRVQLRRSPYGGVSAVVLIPQAMVLDATEAVPAGASRPVGPVSPPPARAGGVPLPPARPSGAAPPAGADTVDARPAESRAEPVSGGSGAPRSGGPGAGAAPAELGERTDTGADLPAPEKRAAAGGGDRAAAGTVADRAEERPAPVAGRTPAGLPWRVRQANLPRQLRTDAPEDTPSGNGVPSVRDPEEVRRMMSSYQEGTRLGRSESSGSGPAVGRVRSTDVPQDNQEG